MHLTIFNVEHGQCALLTYDNGQRLMVDCGHNATTGWRPGDYLASQGITRLENLAITNYDEDHVSGLSNLITKVTCRRCYSTQAYPVHSYCHSNRTREPDLKSNCSRPCWPPESRLRSRCWRA